jgi:hypothetical protein
MKQAWGRKMNEFHQGQSFIYTVQIIGHDTEAGREMTEDT